MPIRPPFLLQSTFSQAGLLNSEYQTRHATSISNKKLKNTFFGLSKAEKIVLCIASFGCIISANTWAEIAQSPLFLGDSSPPNIMLILDNSGSMAWGSLVDDDANSEFTSDFYNCEKKGSEICSHYLNKAGEKDQAAYYSSDWNHLYYNPAVVYTQGIKYDGIAMPDAALSATPINPYGTQRGDTVNIQMLCNWSGQLPITSGKFGEISKRCSGGLPVAMFAFYYTWEGKVVQTGHSDQGKYYKRHDISFFDRYKTYPRPATRTDCRDHAACTYQEEIRNFAHWFSFYRTRELMTKTMLGLAFSDLNEHFRVGLTTLNDNNQNFLFLSSFERAHRKNWYDKIYGMTSIGGTPLVSALNDVGSYYHGAGMRGLSKKPPDPLINKCQRNYALIMTDGYWNDGTGQVPPPPNSIGNQDRRIPFLPAAVNLDPVSGTQLLQGSYFPPPFSEGPTATSNTLADTAMKYWAMDIGFRPNNGGTAGDITANASDPATWQNMATHTIGLG